MRCAFASKPPGAQKVSFLPRRRRKVVTLQLMRPRRCTTGIRWFDEESRNRQRSGRMVVTGCDRFMVTLPKSQRSACTEAVLSKVLSHETFRVPELRAASLFREHAV